MHIRLIVAFALLCLSSLPHPVSAEERVGVVTVVVGSVMVARATETSEPLRFKDSIFLRDRVTTSDGAVTRMLLGGRVLLTAREGSTLSIIEVPGATTIDLASGRIAVTVDRAKLSAGDLVEVRTPHAIVAVPGDTLIVEVGYEGSTFTVLGGRVDVFRRDPVTGAAVEPAVPVAAGHAVTVKGGEISPPRPVGAGRRQALADEFAPPVNAVSSIELAAVRDELARALEALTAATPLAAGAPSAQPIVTAGAATGPRPGLVGRQGFGGPRVGLGRGGPFADAGLLPDGGPFGAPGQSGAVRRDRPRN